MIMAGQTGLSVAYGQPVGGDAHLLNARFELFADGQLQQDDGNTGGQQRAKNGKQQACHTGFHGVFGGGQPGVFGGQLLVDARNQRHDIQFVRRFRNIDGVLGRGFGNLQRAFDLARELGPVVRQRVVEVAALVDGQSADNLVAQALYGLCGFFQLRGGAVQHRVRVRQFQHAGFQLVQMGR
ncbi:hypothetical protein [Paludibacterium denitrificans]|nr:hypothetical protein [Paludibacterium denitrificans]